MALVTASSSGIRSCTMHSLSCCASLNPSAQIVVSGQGTGTGVANGFVQPRAEQQTEQKPATSNKQKESWFYKSFVAEHTMEAKLSKFKQDVAARKGFVGSWFNDSFKYTAWVEVHRVLTERNIQSLNCAEAASLVASGEAVILDVRDVKSFSEVHVEGASNAPLFRLIQGDDLKANLRRFGYALITDFAGTERNPEFIEQALQAVGGDKQKKIIVVCDIGGTLKTYVERTGPKAKKFNDPERMFGRQSRSLKAIYELQQAGFTNVLHMEGGFHQWCHEDLPIAGENVESS